jgi:hypothetical protein
MLRTSAVLGYYHQKQCLLLLSLVHWLCGPCRTLAAFRINFQMSLFTWYKSMKGNGVLKRKPEVSNLVIGLYHDRNSFNDFSEFDMLFKRITFLSFLSSLVWPFLPTHCRCRVLLLHLITLNDTHTHTHTHTSQGSSGRVIGPSRDLYLTAHSSHKRQRAMAPLGFETAIPASEQPQTHALDRAATGIGGTDYRPRKTSLNLVTVIILCPILYHISFS